MRPTAATVGNSAVDQLASVGVFLRMAQNGLVLEFVASLTAVKSDVSYELLQTETARSRFKGIKLNLPVSPREQFCLITLFIPYVFNCWKAW